MRTNPPCIRLEPGRLLQGLQTEAMVAVQTVEGELDLDLSAILRIDPGTARALEELAAIADRRKIKIRLREVNVSVYKTLLLLDLVSKFTFAA